MCLEIRIEKKKRWETWDRRDFFHPYVRRDENVKYIVLILKDMVNRSIKK